MNNTKNKKRNFAEFSSSQNKNIFSISMDRVRSDHNGSTVFIPHVCNNLDLFGAGFAASISKEFPIVKENYHMLGKTFLRNNMGHCQIMQVYENKKYEHKLYVANMIAQNGLPSVNNTRAINYLGLVKSMNTLARFIRSETGFLKKTEQIEIHAPKFGSGLAGGNWNFISDLIEDIWGDFNVYIYGYSKKQAI
ncbi:hypothetical protein EB169_10720 [archaeon]|nr:hypothetical protein [archaeon]